MEPKERIIVIGASAGGITAVSQLIEGIENVGNLCVFIVLHLSRKSSAQNIVRGFQRHTKLICVVAADGQAIENGHLYLAPPDHQLMVKQKTMIVHQGPHENKYRPCIDVLFRSAAVSHRNKVIGIVLTGMLEDGTSGMYAIKSTGGICIIQDPATAEYPDMPQSVLNLVQVDYKASLKAIPEIITDLMEQEVPAEVPVPPEIQIEAELTENRMIDLNAMKQIADHSDFVCPDCGGGLWAIKNDPTHRYRCHTGHVYTENILYDQHGEHLEESVWVSIRMLEERRNMLGLMAGHASERKDQEAAEMNIQRAREMEMHISRMKKVLASIMETI
jgi:two-component system chemotaxis response regulator CheB